MNTFLATIFGAAHCESVGQLEPDDFVAAEELIGALPEMQAIKRWMNWAMSATTPLANDIAAMEPELPDAVIEWMVAK